MNATAWEQDLYGKFSSIGIDQNYTDLDLTGLHTDLQGWGSNHPIFEQILNNVKPKVVIEVGSWKGASLIYMNNICKQLNLRTKFISVDTWLGSNHSMWLQPEYRERLMLRGGFPTMYRQFIFNLLESEAGTDVFPMPMTSTCAFFVLKKLDVVADVIYVDASHEETEVWQDLCNYFQLLRRGGVIFGDDYSNLWLGLVRSVNRFAAENSLLLHSDHGKWSFRKPANFPVKQVSHEVVG